MSTGQPALGPPVAAPRFMEIDISRPARALGVLRLSDYTLVVGCGLGAFGILPDLISSTAHGRWAEVVVEGLMAATMAFAAFTGWRHVGIIDPRVWRSYLRVFPALAGVGVLISLSTVFQWSSSGKHPLEDVHLLMSFFGGLWFAGLAIPGFVCVTLLRRMRVAPMGVPLGKLLTGLIERGGEEAPRITRAERPRFRRGVVFAALGACVLLATTLAPVPADSQKASAFYKVTLQLNTLAFFLIVRARRHFQVSADSLLAVDKRPPILFLRSFTDDERQQYGNSQSALLDFSLETRLANHFLHFGPFIAVGSSKDTVPQPGAARALLADDEWQARVLGWMESASLIVMYCGKTKWVNWELQKIIERGRSTSLILMLPEVKGWRASKRRKDIAERIQQLREAFRSTQWIEDLTEFHDFLGLRAMLFRADGSMVMVRSRSRSRDSYHLAALIAHQQLLDPMPALEPAAARVAARTRHPWRWIGASVVGTAAVLLAALFYIGVSNEPSRLAFKKGELFYAKPVTEAEAGRVGQFLLDREYFSDGKAVTVRLDRNDARYQLQFVINPSYADDLIFATQLGVIGHDISRDVLGGKPLDVLLSDNQWKPIRALPASAKLTFGKGDLYYTDPVTAEQARAVGALLRKFGFFRADRSVTVHLGREQNIYQIRFVIDRSGFDDPSVVKDFRVLTSAVAEQALGNEPVMLHLCDEDLHTLRSERIEGK
jgi:hypothetical protein